MGIFAVALAALALVGGAPPRFTPVSFTAVGESDFWVLGRVGSGYEIARTSDAGRTFATLRAPALPVNGTTPVLRFADRSDGWAYVPRSGIYATHDGGASWRRLGVGSALAFATGGGEVYLVTGRCTTRGCTQFRFRRSPVSADAFTARALPFAADESFDLAAHGSTLWLEATPAGDRGGRSDLLARSSDGGRTFAVGSGPCYPGLGGDLEPVSTRVVWAVCPTGMLAGAWRSTDGGATFAHLPTPPLVNSAVLAPASETTAVVAANGAGRHLVRTTSTGRTWTRPATPAGATYTPWAGFTDARVGYAIVQIGPTGGALWRTTDGGARWSTIRLP